MKKDDLNQNASRVVEQATAPMKNPAAVMLGRLGGMKGGKARAAKLSAEERSAVARYAATSRWERIRADRERCTCRPCEGACFCTGKCKAGCPVHGHSVVLDDVGWPEPEPKPPAKKGSGMEDDPDWIGHGCMNPSHEPPRHMVIPPGKRYRHVCPGCGQVVYIRGSNVRW